jgi:hypothetical protein
MTGWVCVRDIGPGGLGTAPPPANDDRPSRSVVPAAPFIPGMEATILGPDREFRARLVWNDGVLPVLRKR